MSHGDDKWRSDTPSEKQTSRIKWWCSRLGINPPLFNTKGEASDFIDQLKQDHPELIEPWEKKKERLAEKRLIEGEKELLHFQLMGLEMRVDEWRDIHHCKRVPHSAFKKVIEVIGSPPEASTDTEFMAPFFAELRHQRPDLFAQGKGRKPQASQGCL